MEALLAGPRHSSWVISLISAGHFLSHFYFLTLPSMFLFLKEEFGVTYAELGLVMTAYSVLGGFAQSPVGFLVDRIGPRTVLLAGLGINSAAITLIGFSDTYWILLMLAVFAGLGNSVFHPADYSILSGSIRESQLGRAFSIHTFSGFLGSACAPLTMLAIAKATDWRIAFIATGLVGLAVWGLMLSRSNLLVGENVDATRHATGIKTEKCGLKLLLTAPLLLFLAFFITYGMASGGLITFTASGLIHLHDVSVDIANSALTGHLFGIVGGILMAGFIVDKFPRHGLIAAVAMFLAGSFVLFLLIPGQHSVVLITTMTIVGVGLGLVLPPRDLMVRAVTPPGQTGKVFGFIFVGFAVGSGVTPLFFGWLLDNGLPEIVFAAVSFFILLATISIVAARRLSLNLSIA